MSWNTCKYPDCDSWSRRSDGDYCAYHERQERLQIENEARASSKRAAALERQKEKQKIPRQKIKPMSDKRKTESEIYSDKREQFLLTRWCAYHGHGCIPTTVHHSKGRTGTLYLDERYWKALCMVAHEWVEKNPDKAKDLGLSESRLAKQSPTI